jgi:hypothetical protein
MEKSEIRNLKSEIRTTRKWRGGLAVLLVAVVVASLWAVLARGAAPQAAAQAEGVVAGEAKARFVPVDVYVDTGTKKLGAYQAEVVAKNAKVVGVEGGESKAFNDAPYYDPAALQGGKIVVAAFSTDETLPNGLTRVARLHFMTEGAAAGGLPEMATKLVVATDADGKTVDAKLTLRAFEGDKR